MITFLEDASPNARGWCSLHRDSIDFSGGRPNGRSGERYHPAASRRSRPNAFLQAPSGSVRLVIVSSSASVARMLQFGTPARRLYRPRTILHPILPVVGVWSSL